MLNLIKLKRILMSNKRRSFIIGAASTLVSSFAIAQKPPQNLVQDSDPSAIALGYVSDVKKIDTNKFPQYALGQNCAVCTLFQGTAKDADAPCLAFGGKAVSAKGWCSAWVKKG
jgi:hypothetical protein